MLSTKRSTSWFFSSRKYSVIGERGERDAQTRAGRFVHLAVNQRDLGLAEVLLVDDAGFAHFVVKIVAFAGALTDAGEHGVTTVRLGDVVDEFHDDDGLADAGAAERADFAALDERADQVDDLDAGLEDRRPWCPGRRARAPGDESGNVWSAVTGPRSSTGSPVTLKMRPRTPSPTGTEIGRAGVGDCHAALEAFGGATWRWRAPSRRRGAAALRG